MAKKKINVLHEIQKVVVSMLKTIFKLWINNLKKTTDKSYRVTKQKKCYYN